MKVVDLTDRGIVHEVARIAARIGHVCMDFAPRSEKPFICTKRRGHRGHHAALVPEIRNGAIKLRAELIWRRGAR